MFTSCNELFRELSKEVRKKATAGLPFRPIPVHERSISFTSVVHDADWFTRLIRAMDEVSPASNGKQDFLEHCRLLYQKNTSILQSIDEFERTYKSEEAVRWYTREGFLYKVLNQALREQNPKSLRLLHFFIHDLNRQLTGTLKKKDDPYQMWTSMDCQLYRGQLISRDESELLKRSVGEIMSTNSFLSTTMDHDVALMFSGAGSYTLDSPLQPALFHLDCTAWTPTQHVANVQEVSFNADETEILFSPTHNVILIKFDYDEVLHVWKAYFTQDLQSTKDSVHRGFYDDQRLIKLELAVAYLQHARQTTDDMDDDQSSSDDDNDDETAQCILAESSSTFTEDLQLLIKELVLPPLGSVTLTGGNASPLFVLETLRSFKADSLSHEPEILPDMAVTLYDSLGTIYKNNGKFLLAYYYYHRASIYDKPTSPTSYTRQV